jgi:GT2 family glycosyltransferase
VLKSKYPFLTVVYACYKPDETLRQSMAVLFDDIDQAQVVLINNGERQDLAFISSDFPLIQIVQNKKNIGFGAAMNAGFRMALDRKSERVLLLNQDLVFENNALFQLMNAADKFSAFSILSPAGYDSSGAVLDEKFNMYLKNAVLEDANAGVYSVSFVNAAAWLVRTEALAVGGFDPLFFMYSEDEDFAERIIASGRRIGIVMSSKVRHLRKHACSSDRRAAIKRASEMLLSVKRGAGRFLKTVCRELYGSVRIVFGFVPDHRRSLKIVIWSWVLFSTRVLYLKNKQRCFLQRDFSGHLK